MVSERLPHLEDKYEILGKLKEGGMGAVYKVRHRLLDEIRVVKVMRSHLADDPGFAERFNREARAAIRLRHPNIAQLFDFTLDEAGNAYMVLEFVAGRDLKEVLRQHGPLPLGLTLDIAIQALAALAFLHRRGMVHRDISPDNLMLYRDEDGRPVVKLIDLGIVKVLDAESAMTTTGTFLGKVRYASPEQFRSAEGGTIDQRSDLYSVGVVLYELLTGTFPITGDTSSAIMAGHLYRPPVGFEVSDPSGRVPPALRQIVLRLLEKDPDRRYQTADELATALRALQREFPTTADQVDRCCPPAEPGRAGAASPAATPPVSPTAPTVLLPEGHAGDERAAELAAAFDRCLERGEVAEATSLLARARSQFGEGEACRRMEDRLARLQQASVAPPAPAPSAAPAVPAAAPAAGSSRAPLWLVVAAVLAVVALVAVGGFLLLQRLSLRPSPPAASLASPAGAAATTEGSSGLLVIHALPWAEVVEVRNSAGSAVALPAEAATPLALALPPGDYSVRVKHPEIPEARSASARVVAGTTTTVTIEVVAQSAESFLAKMGW